MERVVTINLNGNSYQLEEPAYDALRAYIAHAEAALAENPDKAEIIRDLEQAVADKCGAFLSAQKTVVAGAEMTKILGEMGPVEGAGDAQTGSRAAHEPPRKRLYRITADAKIAGVCSGIGAYFDIDPNIVRLLFIIGALLTSGALVLIYLALMFLIPSAQTSEEWAAAHGVPFNAQEVIDRAKREYNEFAGEGPPWRQRREQRRAWRQAMRERMNSWRSEPTDAPARPVGYATRIVAGLLAFIFSIITAALLIAFVIALFSLLSTGAIFGWMPAIGAPLWLAILVLCIVYVALSAPFRQLRRSTSAAASGYRYGRSGGSDFVTLLAVITGGVLAYHFIPDFHHWIDGLPYTLTAIGVDFN